jgi:hypothetical protein
MSYPYCKKNAAKLINTYYEDYKNNKNEIIYNKGSIERIHINLIIDEVKYIFFSALYPELNSAPKMHKFGGSKRVTVQYFYNYVLRNYKIKGF